MTLLEIRDLVVHFYTYRGVVKALNNVNLEIEEGEVVGLVGETGSGKSVTALSILRLLSSSGRIVGGNIIFKGEDLAKKSQRNMRKIRGRQISMIFQQPLTSLNPVFTIGDQVKDVIKNHQGVTKKEAEEITLKILKDVSLPDVEKKLDSYPHELSGGIQQRVMIAIALSCNPSLLIADEPTTSLDVTTQAQILDLLKSLKRKHHLSILFITHNLGIVASRCDKVAIMYAGCIVERTQVMELFNNPMHPYTIGLLKCIPKGFRKEKLHEIFGGVPSLINPPSGCIFHPRCKYAMPTCQKAKPKPTLITRDHLVSCHLYGD